MSTFSLRSNGIDMGKPYSSKISWNYGGISPLQGRWISYSPALGQYLIGDQGQNPEMYRSTDLITWTSIPGLSGGRWYNARWSPALNLWFAVANNLGAVVGGWTSPDGINWTLRVSLPNAFHHYIAWSPTLALFLVATEFQFLYTSPDGINWTARDLLVAHNGTHYCCIWDTINNMFVVMDATGGGTAARRIHTSADGINWFHQVTPQVGGIDPNWQKIIHAPEIGLNICVAGNAAQGQGRAMISSDNITWTLVNVHLDDPAPAMFGGAWSPTAMAFALPISSGNPRVRRSTDGINWTKSKTRLNPAGVLEIEYLPAIKKFIFLPAAAGERFQFSITGK